MQESNLSRNEAKDKCTKTWTETAYLTLTGSNKNLSFLYLLDREAKVARKDLSRISDLAWLIPAHAPHTINSTLGRFAIRIYNLLETRILISVKDALETVNHTVAAIINDGILLQNGALTTNTRIVKIARTTSESICPGTNMLWAWKPHAPNITTDTGKIRGGPLKVPRPKPSPTTQFPIHHPSPTPILIPCTTLMTLTQSPPPAIQTHNTHRNNRNPQSEYSNQTHKPTTTYHLAHNKQTQSPTTPWHTSLKSFSTLPTSIVWLSLRVTIPLWLSLRVTIPLLSPSATTHRGGRDNADGVYVYGGEDGENKIPPVAWRPVSPACAKYLSV